MIEKIFRVDSKEKKLHAFGNSIKGLLKVLEVQTDERWSFDNNQVTNGFIQLPVITTFLKRDGSMLIGGCNEKILNKVVL